MAQLDKLKELAKKRISQEEAFEFFDSLDTVNLEDTYGLWKVKSSKQVILWKVYSLLLPGTVKIYR